MSTEAYDVFSGDDDDARPHCTERVLYRTPLRKIIRRICLMLEDETLKAFVVW